MSSGRPDGSTRGVYPDPVPQQRTRARRVLRRAIALLAAVALGCLGSIVLTEHRAYADAASFDPSQCGIAAPAGNPGEDLAWQVDSLQLAKAHRLATGKGIKVAVIDTGVDDLNTAYLKRSNISLYNFAPNPTRDGDTAVDCFHGTGVVGMLAGQPSTDPSIDWVGMAPDVTVLAMRALQKSPSNESQQGSESGESQEPTAEAIEFAITQKVRIISISQQGYDNAALRKAVADAVAAGILVVVSAGNFGSTSPQIIYPAAYPGVLAVGMVNQAGGIPTQSQDAPSLHPSLGAPGWDVVTLAPSSASGQAWQSERGTSFAAPLVAGAAALVMQRYPKLTAQEVMERLETTADRAGVAVPDPQIGWGIVNPYRALTDPFVGAPVTPSPPKSTATAVPANPLTQPPPDLTARNIALGIAGGSVAVVVLTLIVVRSVPAGRRRRWRPATRD